MSPDKTLHRAAALMRNGANLRWASPWLAVADLIEAIDDGANDVATRTAALAVADAYLEGTP